MQNLTFRVADARFSLAFTSVPDGRKLLSSYAPFHEPEGGAPLLFTLTEGDDLVSFEAEGKEIGQFDCGDSNHGVYQLADGSYKIVIAYYDGQDTCAMIATPDFKTCKVSLRGTAQLKSFGLNNAIMIAYAFAGAHHGIVLMHSSVAMYKGKGYMFLGKSGTGKSTHTKLWLTHIEGADLLNDDNPAVRAFDDGRITVYGTPWSGKTPCYRQLSVPVGAIVRLEQYPENIIEKQSTLAGFASVLSSCSTMIWDKPSYRKICDTVEAIVRHVSTYHLRNRPDEECVRLSHDTIAK